MYISNLSELIYFELLFKAFSTNILVGIIISYFKIIVEGFALF